MAGLLHIRHYIHDVPEPRSLEDVLGTAQRLGTLGALPIPDVIAHSRQFVDALAGITGTVMDIGTGAGVPGLIIAVDRPDLTLVLTDRREARMDALARGVTAMGIRDRVKVLTADVAVLGQNPEHAAAYDAVVCRGFASPDVTATLARPLLKNGGTLIVSEPPVSDPSRWPADLLNRLGFDSPEYRPGVVCLTANP
jgi:16S rRNA (guanine527-N7)-methyltransferase